MKPIGLLAPCIWLIVLLLSSSAAGARANGATGHSNDLEACKNLDYESCKWSEAEKFAWDKIRAGQKADFNQKEANDLDPKLPYCCNKSRKISSEFLETILFEKPFREAVSRKGVRIIGAHFPAEVDLENGRLPWPLELESSRFENGLNMLGTRVDGDVSLENSFFKEVMLLGARIGDQLNLTGATVTGELNMDKISVGTSLFMRASEQGPATFDKVILRGARIGGQLGLTGATVTGKLSMDTISVSTSLLMRTSEQGPAATFKKVILRGARIGGQLDLTGATVTGELDMDTASVSRSLLIRDGGFADVDLTFATVGSNIDLTGGTLSTLDMTGATVEGALRLIKDDESVEWRSDSGTGPDEIQFNLRNAKVDTLVDRFGAWPNKIELNGFIYRQLGGLRQENEEEPYERSADYFTKWLGRDGTFSLQPYQQLASVLSNAGKSGTADEVLLAGKDRERQSAAGWWEYLWLSGLQYSIGYGIGLYTFRVFYLATFFVLLGWLVLWVTEEHKRHEWSIGRIGLWFSLDYLLPIIRLRDAHYEKVNLSPIARPYFLGRRWYIPVRGYFYVHQIVGYILAFFLIAALTGIVESTP